MLYITYGGIDSLVLDVSEKVEKLETTLNFTENNPLGAYKSNKFGPLHLCMPDMDEFKTTHPDQFEAVEEMLLGLSQSELGKLLYDLWLSSTSIFLSFATSLIWSIIFI